MWSPGPFYDRQFDQDTRSAIGGGLDGGTAAQQSGTLANASQTEAVRGNVGRLEPDTPVLDHHPNRVLFLVQFHTNLLALAVVPGIGEGLLNNAENRMCHNRKTQL